MTSQFAASIANPHLSFKKEILVVSWVYFLIAIPAGEQDIPCPILALPQVVCI
jgi:hypothetical protein